MRVVTKIGADAVQEAALGHNSEKSNELLKEYVEKVAKKTRSMKAISGDIKEILNDAKADGFLETSIKDAVKILEMTDDQIQSAKEVDSETKRITKLCADLPLFRNRKDED